MRNWRAKTAAIAAVSALALAACSSENESSDDSSGNDSSLSGTIDGVGASSQQAAQEAWIAAYTGDNPDVTVNYAPDGSGAGREQFVAGASDFGGTDAYLTDEEGELSGAEDRCGEVVEVPVYISPIAVVFNLEGIDSLNLDSSTIAQIFDGTITTWDDPAIADQNPDVDLPSTKITPVHRSDDSGTTENFTQYLADTAGDDWTYEVDGVWPLEGGEAAQGTSGVIGTVEGAEGTITYADASQAGDLGTAKVQVGDDYVEYSADAASKVLEVSERVDGRGEYDLAYDVARDTTEEGVYPIVLVSYALACQTYDDADTAELVKSYLSYMVSDEGQETAADAAGSAPLPDSLQSEVQDAVDAITSSSGN